MVNFLRDKKENFDKNFLQSYAHRYESIGRSDYAELDKKTII